MHPIAEPRFAQYHEMPQLESSDPATRRQALDDLAYQGVSAVPVLGELVVRSDDTSIGMETRIQSRLGLEPFEVFHCLIAAKTSAKTTSFMVAALGNSVFKIFQSSRQNTSRRLMNFGLLVVKASSSDFC